MMAGGAVVCRMCRSGWMSLNLRAYVSASSVVAFAGSRRTRVHHRKLTESIKRNGRRRGLAHGLSEVQWLNVPEVGCVRASSELRIVFWKSRRNVLCWHALR